MIKTCYICNNSTDNYVTLHEGSSLCIDCQAEIKKNLKLEYEFMEDLDDISFFKYKTLDYEYKLKSLYEYQILHKDCEFTKLIIRQYENEKYICKLNLLLNTTNNDIIRYSCAEKIKNNFKERQEIYDELTYIKRISEGKYLGISNDNKKIIDILEDLFE